MPSPRETVGTVIGLMVLLLLGVVLLGMIFGFATNVIATGETGAITDAVEITGGSGTAQASGSSTVESIDRVRASLNHSVALTGATDSNVTVESDADLGHDLSTCTWGTLDSTVVSTNGTGLLLATESTVLWYNGTADEWRGYYYNVSSRNSYRASVAATSPSDPTLVCLNHGNQTLNVSANTTVGTDVATGAANTAPYPTNVSNWDGTVEETRLYASPLNSSQRSEWVGEPALAVNGSAPAARITYDTFESSLPSSFEVFFAGGSATANNASLATGHRAPAVTEGTDYNISEDTITVPGGGLLEQDGEILYVNGQAIAGGWYSTLTSVSSQAQGVISLANLIPFLLVAFLVIAMLRL